MPGLSSASLRESIEGAQRLTWQSLPPVTPEYLSPQAWLFYIRSLHDPDSYYPPSPADDLYALGMTAYRLVMGQYPARNAAKQDEQGIWHVANPDPRPQLERNPRVAPLLREVIARLLSDEPAARGTATQVAEALEAGAGGEEGTEGSSPPERTRSWKPWLTPTLGSSRRTKPAAITALSARESSVLPCSGCGCAASSPAPSVAGPAR